MGESSPEFCQTSGGPLVAANMSAFTDLIIAHERFIRGQVGGCRAMFRFAAHPGVNLQGRRLDDVEFVGCDLTEAKLALASLKASSFYCTSLRGADLRGADLTNADMRGATLRGASLYRAVLDGADFRKAVLLTKDRDEGFQSCEWDEGEAFDGSDRPVDFTDCSLKGARLNYAKLKGAEFGGAILDGAHLAGADLRGASFDGAVLTNIDLETARTDGASMRNVVRDPSEEALTRKAELMTILKESVKYTKTAGKEGARAVLDGADIRVLGRAFAKAGLAGASIKGVCGIGVDFSNAVLVGAIFDGSDLRGARFDGADLRGCSFRDCNLGQTVFNTANLTSFLGRDGRSFPPRFDGAALGAMRIKGAMTDPGSSLGEELQAAALAA